MQRLEVEHFVADLDGPVSCSQMDFCHLVPYQEVYQALNEKRGKMHFLHCKEEEMKYKDLTGLRVGKITVLEPTDQRIREYSGRFYTPIPEIGNHRSDMKETAIPF